MTDAGRLQAIHDLASARLRNGPLDPNVDHDLKEIVKLSERAPWKPYPDGMGEESRRLHREYSRLETEQLAGAKNAAEISLLCDECEAKGIVLAPNGENL
jgi:hypothetical protein